MKDSQKKNRKLKKSEKVNKSTVRSTLIFAAEKPPIKEKKHANDTAKSKISIKNDILFVLPLVSLLIVLLVLTIYNLSLKEQIARQSLSHPKPVSISDYPYLKQSYAPDITALSAIVVDDTSKVTLFEKNPTLRFSMASTTKIMTALIGLEHFKPKDILTVYRGDVEGAVAGFYAGEKVYFEDMVYALMLPSGNDAAYAIADNYPGGEEAFVARMNEKAKLLRLSYTHYVDPAGLDDDGNYTTAGDLARLASYALKNKTIAKVAATKEKVITNVDKTSVYTLENLNKLLGENGVTGLKTGFTQGAGGVLVTSKEEQGRILIIVVMKSEDRFADTVKLLQLVSNNVTFVSPLEDFQKE